MVNFELGEEIGKDFFPSCHKRGTNELRNRSPWGLCGSVLEHRSAESEDLRFDSAWGLRIFES